MEISVNHILGQVEAKKRILNFSEVLKKEYGNQISNYVENWSSNSVDISFKVMGMNISGLINILHDKVTMSGKVPIMAKMFQGEIERTIKKQLLELLT